MDIQKKYNIISKLASDMDNLIDEIDTHRSIIQRGTEELYSMYNHLNKLLDSLAPELEKERSEENVMTRGFADPYVI